VISVRPASFRAATTFEPINPAPPVTRSIRDLPLIGSERDPEKWNPVFGEITLKQQAHHLPHSAGTCNLAAEGSDDKA
jgi:hypothetical protein